MTKNDCIKNLREINPENLTQDDKKLLQGIKESIKSFIDTVEGETTLICMIVELIEKDEKFLALRDPLRAINPVKQEELEMWKNILDIIEKMLM